MPSRLDIPALVRALHVRVRVWLSQDEGQGIPEYALILALVAIVAIVALHTLGGKVDDVLSTVGSSMQT